MASYCSEYGSTTFTLVFSGTNVGDSVHSMLSNFRRVTEVSLRHNLYSPKLLLDGSYPALIWEHAFEVYNEESWQIPQIQAFYDLRTLINSRPQELQLQSNVGTPVIAFGNCYLQEPRQEEPEDMLLAAAGVWALKFLGTDVPSISS